jgi:hypothetical protein
LRERVRERVSMPKTVKDLSLQRTRGQDKRKICNTE